MSDEIKSSKGVIARIESTIDRTTLVSIPQSQNDMINQAIAVTLEPSFLKAAEQEVGAPQRGESRDEYVARAEKIVIDKLTKLIG